MKGIMIRLLVLIALLFPQSDSQIQKNEIRRVGLVTGRTYNYRVSSTPATATVLIKLIPNLENMADCGVDAVNQYKQLIDRIIEPIDKYLQLFRSDIIVEEVDAPQRFAGVIVGAVALGVATAAHIKAGIALDQSLKNAAAISTLTQAVEASNAAIENLRTATGLTVTMINGVQDHINDEIIPALANLGCSVAANRLGITLTQYYAQLDTTFGPSLQNPAMAAISIQAISNIFGGDLGRLVSTMGYTIAETRDLMEQGMITGKITMVDKSARFIVLEVSFPTLLALDNVIVQELHTVTFSESGSEWVVVVPKMVIQRGPLISGLRHNECKIGRTTVICNQDESYALEPATVSCLSGRISTCVRTRVVNSAAPRFIVSETRVLANCISTFCTCITTGRPLLQSRHETLLDISRETCPLVSVDGVMIKPGPLLSNVTFESNNIDFGPVVSVDPLDQSIIVGLIKERLEKTDEYLAKSNRLLDSIDTKLVNTTSMTAVIAICASLAVLAVVGFMFIAYIMIMIKRNRRAQAERMAYTNSGYKHQL